MYQHIQLIYHCSSVQRIEMLLVRDHNAAATRILHNWYSELPGWELCILMLAVQAALELDITHSFSFKACELVQQVSMSSGTSTPRGPLVDIDARPQRLRFLWILLHACRAIKRCSTVSRAAGPSFQPGGWQTPEPTCS